MSGVSARVFISYVHGSDEQNQFLLEYSNWLNASGIECWIDRYAEDADLPEGWPRWMSMQIEAAEYILVVCSEPYLNSIKGSGDKADPQKGRGAKFESVLLINQFYQGGSLNSKIIPVFLSPADEKFIPDFLQGHTHYDLSVDERKEALYRRISRQPRNPKPEVGVLIDLSKPSPTNHGFASLPALKEILKMKPGSKIVQRFLSLTMLERCNIAKELGVIEENESALSPNPDRLSSSFLERIYKKGLIDKLWTRLFDEKIDPNPFKKNS